MGQIAEKRFALATTLALAISLTLTLIPILPLPLTLTLTRTLTRTANKNAMTPLEAMLNRDLLLSIASGKGYEPANIMG